MRESRDVKPALVVGRWGAIAASISFILLTAGVIALAANNLGNRYFWTDESSSLFTSLGWPGVGERAGTLGAAWDWILNPNLEPGLYNILERYWALGVGTGITTLRLYALLFFLLYLFSVIALGRLVMVPWFLVAGVLALMLLENITPYYSVELRPSSAGLAASVMLPLLGLLLLRKPQGTQFAVFIAGILFIGSMQYNSYPVEAALGAVLVMFGWIRYRGGQRRILVGAGVIAVLWLPLLYLVTRGSPFQAVQSAGFDNISSSLIPNMEPVQVLMLMQQNLLSPTALPRTVFLLLVPVLWLTRRWPRNVEDVAWRVQSVNFLWAFVLLATVASAGIGFLGLMPWIVGTRWSIADVGLIAVSLVGIAGVLVQLEFLRRRTITVAAMVLSVAFSAIAGYRLATYERFPGYDWNPALVALLAGQPGQSVVDTEIYTDLRYWVELSGDYDQFRPDWIDHRIRTTSDFSKADVSNIEKFLSSTDDRLLLSDASLLEDPSIQIPDDVKVIYVPRWEEFDGFTPPQPVLLVRDP